MLFLLNTVGSNHMTLYYLILSLMLEHRIPYRNHIYNATFFYVVQMAVYNHQLYITLKAYKTFYLLSLRIYLGSMVTFLLPFVSFSFSNYKYFIFILKLDLSMGQVLFYSQTADSANRIVFLSRSISYSIPSDRTPMGTACPMLTLYKTGKFSYRNS